jgi:hypothetical protein
MISLDHLQELRRGKYRQTPDTHIRTEDDALDFINELGFVWLIDLSDADLPSLHKAAPESYENPGLPWHDQIAHSWWDSKQTLSGRKACCYAKVLRGRGTFISWECFPLFYAVYATGNEYMEDYRRGILSRDEKRILDLIAGQPEISSRDLRRRFGSPGKDITRAMDRALQGLQETFRITVAGGSLQGWTVHNWALVEDWVAPECLDQARRIEADKARQELALRYVNMSVAASVGDIAWVFRWKRRDAARLVAELLNENRVVQVEVTGLPGEMVSVPDSV